MEILSFLIVTFIIIILFLLFGEMNGVIEWINANNQSKIIVALICFALLLLDIVLPLPSSVIMILTASILGGFAGFIVNYVGIVLSNVMGYYLGQFLPLKFQQNKETLNRKNRKFAGIILTRGVPVLAESVAITSGIIKFPKAQFIFAILIGNLPYCMIYSISGYWTFQNLEIMYALCINVGILAILFLFQKGIVFLKHSGNI